MSQKFISLKSVADSVYSNKKMRDMPFSTMVRWVLELMQIVKCPLIFLDKEEVLNVHEHRAFVPCDFYEIRQMKLERPCCHPGYAGPLEVKERTETVTVEDENGKVAKTVTRQIGVQQVALMPQHDVPVSPMFKEGTNTFEDANFHPNADLTYKIQDNVIITSIPEGKVRLAYQAIKTDNEGFPMIVDDASFLRALESYVKYRWYQIQLENGELAETETMARYIFEKSETDYYANVAQAEKSLLNITPEKMRNIANIFNDAIPRYYEHATGYNDLNKEHTLRVHP